MALGRSNLLLYMSKKTDVMVRYIATTAAIAAGTATAAAYTEAKFHIWKDINTLYGLKKIQYDFEKAGTVSTLCA